MTAAGDLSVSLLAAGPSVSSQLLGSALIGLREGLETAIVVTILVAFLVKSDRRDALKWVWLGRRRRHRDDRRRVPGDPVRREHHLRTGAEAIAGIASLIAVAIVTTMVLWMKKAAATISGELRGDMARALETGGARRGDAGLPGRRPRRRRDRAVHGRLRRGQNRLAADRTASSAC